MTSVWVSQTGTHQIIAISESFDGAMEVQDCALKITYGDVTIVEEWQNISVPEARDQWVRYLTSEYYNGAIRAQLITEWELGE